MSDAANTSMRRLFWMALALFLSYLAIAMPLPVLSAHVIKDFGYSNSLGGLAVGIAFVSTIFSRKYAGSFCDQRGARLCTIRGLFIYVLALGVCLASTLPALSSFNHSPAYSVLLAGRLLLGIGESLTIVGIISWNIGLMGPQNSGRVMAMVGMAMYGAYAAGGPLGDFIYQGYGFAALMSVSLVLPLAGLVMVWREPETELVESPKKEPFIKVIGRVWRQGAALGLQGVGFGALGAFIALYFQANHWEYAGLGLTCFGGGFVLVRVFVGHLPDKIGGVPVALCSLAVEAVGQALLWLAPNEWVALAGALLTGCGCSMVYPALGVEVIKAVPADLRGTAFGVYAAFQDISYAFTGPLAGLCADHLGYSYVFLLGTICAVGAFGVAMSLRHCRQ